MLMVTLILRIYKFIFSGTQVEWNFYLKSKLYLGIHVSFSQLFIQNIYSNHNHLHLAECVSVSGCEEHGFEFNVFGHCPICCDVCFSWSGYLVRTMFRPHVDEYCDQVPQLQM